MKNAVWFVYILRCSDKSFYIGIAKNVAERLEKHNAGKGAKYTRGRGPVILVYRERKANRSSAQRREAQIKKWRRLNKERLIRGSLPFRAR